MAYKCKQLRNVYGFQQLTLTNVYLLLSKLHIMTIADQKIVVACLLLQRHKLKKSSVSNYNERGGIIDHIVVA